MLAYVRPPCSCPPGPVYRTQASTVQALSQVFRWSLSLFVGPTRRSASSAFRSNRAVLPNPGRDPHSAALCARRVSAASPQASYASSPHSRRNGKSRRCAHPAETVSSSPIRRRLRRCSNNSSRDRKAAQKQRSIGRPVHVQNAPLDDSILTHARSRHQASVVTWRHGIHQSACH